MYQVSLEGHIHGRHAQLDYVDVETYAEAMEEARKREHLPPDPAEEWVAFLFTNRDAAVRDGIPSDMIEALKGEPSPLYRYIFSRLG